MSTPIETNTEELRGILEDVYNLPARNGGSQPDLVIGLNVENPKACPDGTSVPNRDLDWMTLDDVTILSGSVSTTVEKFKQGFPVRVLLKDVHFYWGDVWFRSIAEASDVVLESHDANFPEEDRLRLTTTFFVSNCGSCLTAPTYMRITFDAATGEVLYYYCKKIQLVG